MALRRAAFILLLGLLLRRHVHLYRPSNYALRLYFDLPIRSSPT